MKIGINHGYVKKIHASTQLRSPYETALLCKAAGFENLDISCQDVIAGDDWRENAEMLSENLKREGINVHQTHAPFNRYTREGREIFDEKMRRSFEVSAILGADNIVVHADEYVSADGKFNASDACDFAYEYFAPFVEVAKKKNLGMAVENLFEDSFGGVGRTRYTSEVEEVIELIDRFNDKAVTCCWDFGHAAVAFGEKMLDKLKMVGKRLSSTHVHDNYFSSDAHMPIFLGKIDWEAHMKYLHELGYDGVFTYEFVYGSIPEPLLEDYLKLAYKTAQYAISIK